MESYTDVEQSKKLAEILPLESADMAWCNNSIRGVNYTDEYSANLYTVKEMQECFDKALNGWDKYWKLIPCWSLAALLDVLPEPELIQNQEGSWMLRSWDKKRFPYSVGGYDNTIDACYNMILKLHELKML